MNPKKQEEFVPQYLYIEDYWEQYIPPPKSEQQKKDEDKDVERGVYIIDIM